MKNYEQVMKQALEALKDYKRSDDDRVSITMGILQAALAKPREHVTDGSPCWCNPETTYIDPNTDGLDFSNTKPTGCLPPQKPVMPRWVAVFEEEAKKPLSVIGLKRDDIKQAARDYKLMQDLYESVSNIRDAAVRILAEAQGQKTGVLFEPLNLQTLSSCIDHHAAELFRLRAKVQNLEKLLEQKQ